MSAACSRHRSSSSTPASPASSKPRTSRTATPVTQGQLLYVIEQPPYQAAVAQAQAAVEQARAQSHNANLTLGRAQALLNTPAGLPSSVDSGRAAALSGAAQIASATAQLQTAQIDLGYTEIHSPIDGRISATNVDVGNVVGPNSGPLATVVSQDPMWITFSLPALEALDLQSRVAEGGLAGVELLVKLPSGQTYNQTASIDFVNNQITQSTDTLAMRGTIANPPVAGLPNADTGQRVLQDGEFINVVLRDRTAQQQITVPQQAVVADQLGSYVLVVDKTGTARRQNVTTGQTTPDSVAILSGLKAGDSVVDRWHPAGPSGHQGQPATGQERPVAGLGPGLARDAPPRTALTRHPHAEQLARCCPPFLSTGRASPSSSPSSSPWPARWRSPRSRWPSSPPSCRRRCR